MRRTLLSTAVLVAGLIFLIGLPSAPAQSPARVPQANPAPTGMLPPPVVETHDRSGLRPPQLADTDHPLPINLATALRLADARPLIIEAARAAVETEYGLYEQARVLWLPTVYVGVDYQRHDGGEQNLLTGQPIIGTRNQFLGGAGAQMVFALTDAIYSPLAERQLLRARNIQIQTASNDALLAVAEAYFDVQQARGILAGSQDVVVRARDLERRVASLGAGLTAPIEVERVRATRAEFEEQVASARQDWRFTSATLTQNLRLDPAAVVVPVEPPHLQVTLISPQQTVDNLIPIGLQNRPELAFQQAVVEATLTRLRQERLRPLLPSLVLQSNATPTGFLGAGAFGTGTNGLTSWTGRSDWDAEAVWEFKNLGFGNRGLITQRRGEQRQALIEQLRIQDLVAAEVTQAHAQVEAAAVRVVRAEAGLKAALLSYEGNLKGLSETLRVGDLLQLVVRPQEAVAALQQLQKAYINYYTTTNDYNRAQFRLFRALGYASQSLSCSDTLGKVMPVDPSRPPQMAPIQAVEPCQNCRPH
jgi:outer membrane protein TolC